MRIRIEVHSALGTFVLPQGYNPYVQGLINACIPTDIPWSGDGQGAEEGHFKLFTFSQLYARSVERIDVSARGEEKGDDRVRYQLVMSSPVWFYLSSPSQDFIEALIPRLEHSRDLHIERNLVEDIHVSREPSHAEMASGQVSWRIRTISPVTVYQGDTREGRSTTYYAPDDPLFSKIVLENAVRKYYAWTHERAPSEGFSIKCLDRTPHLAVISFKDTPVRCYTGRFQLTGDARLLAFLLESGLGGKNSHGFGMFDIVAEPESGRPSGSRTAGAAEHGNTRVDGRQKESGHGHREQARASDTQAPASRPQTHRTPARGSASGASSQTRRQDGSWSGGNKKDSGFRSERQHTDRRNGPRSEEPRRKFVSRYAPEIRPVSREKAASGSYSIWDGQTRTELPRFVRPDGTESTGGPRKNTNRPAGHSPHGSSGSGTSFHGKGQDGTRRTPGSAPNRSYGEKRGTSRSGRTYGGKKGNNSASR